ncbi:MAG: 23S rRNA (guanosine(2251)-2'-O)-methyltransferase RlmB [Actinobacteria bacterium]|nr:23S rRNA (guanosine(2251)-2'-O)-methyltransferase RlmB [Actinomycetota bacterium]
MGGSRQARRARARAHRAVILYGRNPVREALRARRRAIAEVWATERALAREPWLREAGARIARPEEIERRSGSSDHQGVCADAGGYPYVSAPELLAVDDPFIVALDELQDPQNLGAIARSAECAGVTGLVICERRAATITPAVAKASAGAVEHLRVARVRNMADFLRDAKQAGAWCYGADAAATTRYDEPDYRGGAVVVIGAEGTGLRPRVAKSCDALVALPLRGHTASLNASAAAAVLVYEVLQRRESA